MSIFQFSKVPGLYLYNRFLSNELHAATLEHIRATQEKVRKTAESSLQIKARTYLSKQHNLQTDEFYRKVEINLPGDMKAISLQYFQSYGSKGHELCYGIGKKNISSFMLESVFPRLKQLQPIDHLYKVNSGEKPVELRLTTNFYSPSQDTPNQLPGFHWHKDTPGNGSITAIYTLKGDPVIFEIKNEDNEKEVHSLSVTEGSLLILSEESRWKWLHRIVPSIIKNSPQCQLERISLAFGFKT
jgi:hypothetical protein